jgi:methionyl-tRNA formyltransferase
MTAKTLNIIFLGTAEFAIPALTAIIKSPYKLIAVVTKSDKPSGRGLKEKPSPVKLFLQKYHPAIKLMQPDSLKNPSFQEELADWGADLFVVCAFPIMPSTMVKIPRLGCINIHPSLLPKYRGAAPIRWSLINGETKTGVTTFFIGEKIDAGNILLQREIVVSPEEDYGELHHRLSLIGAELAPESIALIANGTYHLLPQDESLATPAPKIQSEDLLLDWNSEAVTLNNRIRAFSPEPGAFTILDNKRLKIFRARPEPELALSPGETLRQKKQLLVGCSKGSLAILEIQLEDKKRMPIEDFLKGYRGDCIIQNSKLKTQNSK